MYIETTFGSWLRQRRRLLDLTQADLARRIGCSEITIRKIEADERTPSRQVAKLLAACLDIPEPERLALISFARGRQRPDGASLATPETAHLRTLSDIPLPLTQLYGRDEEVALICRQLRHEGMRMLTLIGPPGVGKTHLSLQAAVQLCDLFADGVVFVPLTSVDDPALLLGAIAQALGITETLDHPPLAHLSEVLHERQMLLILDTCEHLLPAAPEVAHLLTTCPQMKVLATSRAALHVRGEHLIPIATLGLPEVAYAISAETAARSPAVQLFVERAQAVAPHFALSNENAGVIAEICRQLDGLPLAIELVAAHSRLLSPPALLARLGQRLDLLIGGPSDLPARHQTLYNAIAWSYNLLAPAERRLFEQLGIFEGDYNLEAIETLYAGLGIEDGCVLPDLLEALIDNSLVMRHVAADGELRFSMLETIREYALMRLKANGEHPMLFERYTCISSQRAGVQDQGIWTTRHTSILNPRSTSVWRNGSWT